MGGLEPVSLTPETQEVPAAPSPWNLVSGLPVRAGHHDVLDQMGCYWGHQCPRSVQFLDHFSCFSLCVFGLL